MVSTRLLFIVDLLNYRTSSIIGPHAEISLTVTYKNEEEGFIVPHSLSPLCSTRSRLIIPSLYRQENQLSRCYPSWNNWWPVFGLIYPSDDELQAVAADEANGCKVDNKGIVNHLCYFVSYLHISSTLQGLRVAVVIVLESAQCLGLCTSGSQ
ncbi:hypothetical protein PROFUN_14718 [Planoprotostelium fungivorum]|uniref:Uncharacterized protein n=1 Tax=Planoprotostelium fungivorum TaxID=1890364 RepID=A0A2P6MZ70_9EUKA|nr:hypothetical protein PROFUN_14718 [Planoprotostelium fungivorum]